MSADYLSILPIADQIAIPNHLVSMQAESQHSRPITWSLFGMPPAGASIDSASGLFTWTPKGSQHSHTPYPITVQVDDGVLGPLTTTFNITVSNRGLVPSSRSCPKTGPN